MIVDVVAHASTVETDGPIRIVVAAGRAAATTVSNRFAVAVRRGGTDVAVAAAGVRVAVARVGTRGPAGPAGGAVAGTGDLSYVHRQEIASTTWTVVHGLGKRPSVTVVDGAGDEVEGGATYVDPSTMTLTFSAACSGTAYLN